MRHTALAAFCGIFVLAAPAGAAEGETAPGPSADHPLSPLCERICGGVWRQSEELPSGADGYTTSYKFAWNARMNVIYGSATTVGGVAGTAEERAVIYGYDRSSGKAWVITAGGQGNPVYGEIAFNADGFVAEQRPLGGDTSSMTLVTVFDGANRFTQTATITHQGGRTVASPQSFVRVSE